VAVSGVGGLWYLVNASPDLGAQMNASPALHPGEKRESKIAGVLLTNADLDHVLGLALLREGPRLSIHATQAVRESLRASGIAGMLETYCGVDWREPEGRLDGGLLARTIHLQGGPPPYQKQSSYTSGHSVAYHITDAHSGGRLLIAPDVGAMTPELLEAMREADCILFDGTFWTGDELRRIREGARTAEAMGHLPIRDGSLETLRAMPARHKVYFHINNTNPILDPHSAERVAVESAGMRIGRDGMEFDL